MGLGSMARFSPFSLFLSSLLFVCLDKYCLFGLYRRLEACILSSSSVSFFISIVCVVIVVLVFLTESCLHVASSVIVLYVAHVEWFVVSGYACARRVFGLRWRWWWELSL